MNLMFIHTLGNNKQFVNTKGMLNLKEQMCCIKSNILFVNNLYNNKPFENCDCAITKIKNE